MIGKNIFQMIVEFKFEAGNALLASNALKGSVDGVSEAADRATNSLKGMFSMYTTGMLGLGSVGGILYKSIGAFEQFAAQRNQFNAILGANQGNLQGAGMNTYAGRQQRSEQLLQSIAQKAGEFNIDEQAFASTSKVLIAALAPKGLAGDNFSNALDVSRNYMKTLPMLGLDPSLAMGQLIDAIGGNAFKGRLFERLKDDTSTFRDYNDGKGIKTTKEFNALEAAERLKVLNDAMAEFTSDVDVMADRMNTINAQLGRLKDMFFGLDGVFIQLGQNLNNHVVTALKAINASVESNFIPIFKDLIEVFNLFTSDTKNLTVNLLQLRKASDDYRRAQKLMGAMMIKETMDWLSTIGWITAKVGGFLKVLRVAFLPVTFVLEYLKKVSEAMSESFGTAGLILGSIADAFGKLIAVLGTLGAMRMIPALAPAVTALFTLFKFIATRFLPMFAVIFTSMQIISRAAAKATLMAAENLPKLAKKLSEGLKPFFRALAWAKDQLEIFMDWASSWLAGFIGSTSILESFIDLIVWFGDKLTYVFKGFHLFSSWVGKIFDDLSMFTDVFMRTFETIFSFLYLQVQRFNPLASDQSVRSAQASYDYSKYELDRLMPKFLNRETTWEMFERENRWFDNNVLRSNKDPYATTKNEVNVNQPNINLNMKFDENMEPDRIALAIQQQFIKSALSPLSSDAVNNPVSSLANATAG